MTLVSQDLKCQVKLSIIYKVLYKQTNTIVCNKMTTKSNEKCIKLLMNICQLKPSDLISFCFYKVLHQQILFFKNIQNFIQHYLKKKKIFITNFPFLTNSLKPSKNNFDLSCQVQKRLINHIDFELAPKKKYVAGLEGIFFCCFKLFYCYSPEKKYRKRFKFDCFPLNVGCNIKLNSEQSICSIKFAYLKDGSSSANISK